MKGNKNAEGHITKVMGNRVNSIACGGRHSVAVTGLLFLSISFWQLFLVHFFFDLKMACANNLGGLLSGF
jgi:hypothetical protein